MPNEVIPLWGFTIFFVIALAQILAQKMSENVNIVKFDGVFDGVSVVSHGFSYAN